MKARSLSKHHSQPFTLRQWGELPDDVEGELVDGLLEEEEVTTEEHDAVAGYLYAIFWQWVKPRKGTVFISDRKYAVSARRGRKPDLSVFLPGRTGLTGSSRVTTVPPDIAVEVITPTPRDTHRDRVEKAREYARFGIRWYWLVDPSMRTIEVLELDPKGKKYLHLTGASGGKLRVPGCRGLVLDLDDLWADQARLSK